MYMETQAHMHVHMLQVCMRINKNIHVCTHIQSTHTHTVYAHTYSERTHKESRFRKHPQYVFFHLWQKELRELAAVVYNLLKGRRQHVMPVGEFMDRVSNSDKDVEANLFTVFQSVRGSKQYWFLRRSEALCMLREYGSPTLFFTLSCAEYESLVI